MIWAPGTWAWRKARSSGKVACFRA
ncbi:hypothetical protein ACLWNE_02265 [Thermus oshimai]